MLIAVVMLFFMSYWLLSKVESRRWKAWLEGKLTHSLSRGSLVGLWLTSFLAVYREGAETVLFYYALVGDAQSVSGHLAIGAGFVIGCVLLLAAWLIMRYSVVRLPLKPFFIFTGGFMYLMAFVFAGKGVLELIEGKLFQLRWLAACRNQLAGHLSLSGNPDATGDFTDCCLVALWITLRRNHLPTAQIKNNTSTN
jgi:high-affinity iron transporter